MAPDDPNMPRSRSRDPHQAGATMVFARQTTALVARGLRGTWRRPVVVATSLALPSIVAVSLYGTFINLPLLPGFPTSSALSWYVPLAVILAATLTGAGVATTVVGDVVTGFEQRLVWSGVTTPALLTSAVMIMAARLAPPTALVLLIAEAMGVLTPAGATAFAVLFIVAVGTGAAVTLSCIALAFRFPDQQTGLLVQALALAVLLLSDALIPVSLMRGWLRSVAQANPMSVALGTARAGFIGQLEPGELLTGSVVLVGAMVIAWWIAARSVRKWLTA
jgi:ABC-2 type transport system permease protein